jgi:hypothetical protein
MSWLARKFWRHIFRRLFAGISLFAYLTTALGMPLPQGQAKDHSQPFPCQDSPCGCHNAEQCWRHCCCHSPEERLAWARANQIEPPAYAELPSSAGWQSVRVRDRVANEESSATRCACRKPPTESAKPRSGKSCCSDRRASSDHSSNESTKDQTRQSTSKRGWVRGVDVLRCHNLSAIWVSSGAASPPPPIVAWHPCWPFAGQLLETELIRHIRNSTPPEPPPRSI